MRSTCDEFRHRKTFVDNLHYREAKQRLGGLHDWLMSNPDVASIINSVYEQVDINSLLEGAGGRTPPLASSPEDVAGVGFEIMRLCKEGKDLIGLSREFGIAPSYDTSSLQDYSDEVMGRFVEPALDYIERELDEAAASDSLTDRPIPQLYYQPEYPPEIRLRLKTYSTASFK